jgi:hypothetical protein
MGLGLRRHATGCLTCVSVAAPSPRRDTAARYHCQRLPRTLAIRLGYDHRVRIPPSLVALALPLVLASHARADTGAAFEIGYVRSRVAVTDRTALPGESARFAIRIAMGRHLRFGAEAEEGRLAGQSSIPAGTVARTTGEPTGPLEGNTLGLKAFVGAGTQVGRLLVGADVAGGVRDTWVSSDLGMDVAGRKNEPLLELRSRADVQLTPRTAIGAVASMDLIERRDLSVAAVFALQFWGAD